MKPYLILKDIVNNKEFKKEFETEYKRDKFARKLKYSNKIKIIKFPKDKWLD